MATRSRDDVSTVSRAVDTAYEAVTAYVVTVLEGPDSGAELKLDGAGPQRALVGQSAACDFRLADREVSRRHLAFDAGDGPLRVTDLGSRNGTFVNGVRMIEAQLYGGESIRLGGTTLRVVEAKGERRALSRADRFGQLLGASHEMRRLYPLCQRLAETDVPVVIEGETGTGKEVLAESLHGLGPRAAAPFLVFDCTTVPANLVEAELFGHERGAFTGAVGSRKGIFEQAEGGTLLIDEIGDLDLALQPKLLRAIQRAEVKRVGGDQWMPVNVRILAATRRDLDREVQAGRFRDDLFFRLAVARVELPPLRRRHGDVALLARAFWSELGGEGAPPYDLVCRWERYDWPGNVRELRNRVVQTVALGELAAIERAPAAEGTQLAGFIQDLVGENIVYARARERVLALFEQHYVTKMVERHGGNVSHAATAAGLALRYFQLIRARHSK
jgi:two-component system, NtrC family, response regulator HydG